MLFGKAKSRGEGLFIEWHIDDTGGRLGNLSNYFMYIRL